MRKLILLIVLSSLFLSFPAVADPLPPASPPPGERDYIAWSDTPPSSTWVRVFPDGRSEILASRPQIFVAHTDKLWYLNEYEKPAKVLDEDCARDSEDEKPEDDPGKCLIDGTLTQTELKELSSGQTALSISSEPDGTDNGLHIITNVGPVLFITMTSAAEGLAHSSFSTTFKIHSLDPSHTPTLDLKAVAISTPSLLADLKTEISENGSIEDGDLGTLTLIHLAYSASSPPKWVYQFTFDSDYVDHDDSWDSYSFSVHIRSDKAPPGFALTPTPEAVQKVWSNPKFNSEAKHGWSEITADPATKAKLLEIFRKP